MAQEKKDFLHINGDEGFQSRANSIFESLDNLEPSKESEKSPPRHVSGGKRRRPNQVPDHVLHPEKWTKYSLEEDGSESLGRLSANEVNRHAALSFLNDLKNRRKTTEKESDSSGDQSDNEKHHSFAKPRDKLTDTSSTDRQHAISKQGVTVMPEYVVGKTKTETKTSKKKKITSVTSLSSTSSTSQHTHADVHISHLLDTDLEPNESELKEHDKEKVVFTKHKHRQSRNIRKQRSNDGDE